MHYKNVNFLKYGCPGGDVQHQLLPFHRFYGSVRKKYPVTGTDSPQEGCLFLEIGARKESSICLVASRCYKSLGKAAAEAAVILLHCRYAEQDRSRDLQSAGSVRVVLAATDCTECFR